MPRWHLACDRCDAEAWVGGHADRWDAWCEACQRATPLEAAPERPAPCPHCGVPLTTRELRFEELYGELQNLAAVLGAWNGDAALLEAILPERPRFLTDLDPPAVKPDDADDTREALERLAAGAFADARARLESLAARAGEADAARLWRAAGIAAERMADLPAAERAFTAALAAGEDATARLARGAVRARRASFAEAREDLEHAGDGHEARWNRAALQVLEAVALTPGLPASATIEAARTEAGEPSPYWSDHTVGRLLWTLLVERAQARMAAGAIPCADERVLRAAEGELEFSTFWDRALVIRGYAALGMKQEIAEAASSLALELVDTLSREPFLRGNASELIARHIASAATAIRGNRPESALPEIRAVMEREDVRHYRLPCARCGEGAVGVDRVEED
jgi:tetratricopeptide (TPR) repeat protein